MGAPMTTQVETVKRLYRDFARGDVESILAACSHDCRWTIPGSAMADDADTLIGQAEIGEFVAALIAQTDIESFMPESFMQDGDWVVAVGHYRGTHRETRCAFSKPWLHCWRLREESARDASGRVCRRIRIVSFDDSFDTLSARAANQPTRSLKPAALRYSTSCSRSAAVSG
jgi:ketosteroid isomerase-like protein